MHGRSLGWLGLCLVGCFGCFTPGPPPPSASSQPPAAIAEGNQLLAAALEVGNPDRIATVFADDATLLDASVPGTIHGHIAIADYWRQRLATTRYVEVGFTTTELTVVGDLAYEVGTSKVQKQTGEAPPVVSTGRYLAVWRLGGGGRWRIEADAFLSDAPR